ncbi:hypothetical protein DT076_14755 [Desertihabitans brevis]|uniref:Uncharacterized protein n=1 Tax=Desertihabitans brevis TaxID=2268447 RepID=A0A367YSV3_9ACTN|nr:DUF6069 family protein [Desertihabitans brevis]RCK68827.1 hypothetical protein DT076_14755 [Desertihabitans brevis]
MSTPTGRRLLTPKAVLVRGVVAAVLATVLNMLLFVTVRGQGASMEVAPFGGPAMAVVVSAVAVVTAVVVLVGAGIAALLARWSSRWVMLWAWAAVVIGIATALVPLSATDEFGTAVGLAVLHIVPGAVLAVALLRRTILPRRDSGLDAERPGTGA